MVDYKLISLGYLLNQNLDKLPELQVIADRRKKYIRLNTSYKITNEFF